VSSANNAGGVLLFPFIRLFAPFRQYLVGFTFLALVAYQTSLLLQPPIAPIRTDDSRLADVVAYEDLLCQKADRVLTRFGADTYTVDLSVTLDHAIVTTTTFDPGEPSCSEDGNANGVWREEVCNEPRISRLKVCVTIPKEENLDQDQLFRSLSYTLGVDLSRGDLLRIVSI
jgi:hypothetical protein